jgi:IPT/TIG domain
MSKFTRRIVLACAVILPVFLGSLGAAGASAMTLRVTHVSPATTPEFTSVPVKIHGSGFATAPGATTISFGGTAASNVSCSSTTMCTAMTPELGMGVVSVTATVAGNTSTGPNSANFTYGAYAPPEVLIGSCELDHGVITDWCFSQRKLTDRYPAIFTTGNVYLNITNTTNTTQTLNGPTGPVSLEPGDTEGYNVPVQEGSPYLFELTTGGTTPRLGTLTVKTKAPR